MDLLTTKLKQQSDQLAAIREISRLHSEISLRCSGRREWPRGFAAAKMRDPNASFIGVLNDEQMHHFV